MYVTGLKPPIHSPTASTLTLVPMATYYWGKLMQYSEVEHANAEGLPPTGTLSYLFPPHLLPLASHCAF